MIGAEFTSHDALILASSLVLFVLLALLASPRPASTASPRLKAEALAHEHPRRGRAL